MGYENGLIGPPEDWQQAPPRIEGGEEAGQWDPGTIEKWWGYVKSAGKYVGSLDDPIHWKQEPGMQAVSNDQFTVSGSTQLTRNPKGSRVNVAEGRIKPGDIVIEWARGTAANTKNSYVYVSSGAAKGKQGWIKTMFLTQIRDMGPDQTFEPKPINGDVSTPKTKLPVLPIAAIGYFLLNR